MKYQKVHLPLPNNTIILSAKGDINSAMAGPV